MPLFAASDMHGHRAEFREALRDAGLIDAAGDWSGADARLWLLGDYFDRGPDGVGVIDDIRRLAGQAPASGGEVHALLGNHEAQLLAAYRFGHTVTAQDWDFYDAWVRYGGQESDIRRLTPEHVEWLLRLPATALVDDHLLVHSDTTNYLAFGDSVATVNAMVTDYLNTDDPEAFLYFCGMISGRASFRTGDEVERMFATFGGIRLVHGHSTLISQFGVRPDDVRTALSYSDDRVLAVDGGVFEGGRVLVTPLPFPAQS
ncbi:metallophosphoesterase [Actinoplanes sp. NBRC 101535]|uniref:metallophosphoesterase n=1 Tax=Actinoplanes sp. NBRC 101535 TaxID=3032196 RepID=UPI0024A410A9|nr:metallophosphoesterase [Actinoplanes sp. NBRC 101535]GLX99661.1 serine/threonine protein phosphatase [Actinoplanes sp. NBRC 101535]